MSGKWLRRQPETARRVVAASATRIDGRGMCTIWSLTGWSGWGNRCFGSLRREKDFFRNLFLEAVFTRLMPRVARWGAHASVAFLLGQRSRGHCGFVVFLFLEEGGRTSNSKSEVRGLLPFDFAQGQNDTLEGV